ncbi:CNNM domain-containing protein [Mycoplasmopsis gallinarum]|uniref:CNNM domain-containing protein n=1 Tax=Mycoplasmopsis gallinarum TaxID=29557 RepID=UPI0004805B0E|nr:CNNM domain-containing protein [Mycoplasmopsis gallinarum]
MSPWLQVSTILLVILLIASAIFSASETAYTSINSGKIETIVDRNEFGAKLIKKQYKFFNQTLSTILICNNIVNIAASALISYIFSSQVGFLKTYNVLISTLVMTPIIVIFGEIIPKLIAKRYPITVAKIFCYPLVFLYYLFWIFTYPIGLIGKKIYITNSEEDVKNLIDIAQNEGVLETNESLMAQNALDLDSTKVRRHYVKLNDVTYIDSDESVLKAQEVFLETNYSRLPVRNKDEQFLGIVLLKDIFNLKKGKVINYVKAVPQISANVNLSKALEILRLNKSQMAFVTENNTSSDVIGIITIEDIIEEIVGEIYDEHDEDEWQEIFEVSLEQYQVASTVKMRQIIKELGLDLNLNKKELNYNLKEYLESASKKKLNKSFKYQIDDITFDTLKILNKKTNHWLVEIFLGSHADLLDETEIIEISEK